MAGSKKAVLFDDDDVSDDEAGSGIVRVNKNYADAYDKWRQKEELQKLKDRYGNIPLAEDDETDESSSEDDPFEGFTQNEERDFLKKLAIVKTGSYKKYQGSSKDDDADSDSDNTPHTSAVDSMKRKTKRKREKVYLKDYERRLILEREGKLSDDDEDIAKNEAINPRHRTYAEEQEEIKRGFHTALAASDDDDDLLQPRQKTAKEEAKEEEEYVQWLKGQKESVGSDEIANDLKPLRDYWNDPKLDEGERFLRDYILNRRYMDDGVDEDDERIPSYDEVVGDEQELEDDEAELERQEQFEHKYNFRFEEPDVEFIKTYPRTVGDSLRRNDDKRKQKRDEYKRRKEEEKREKIEEIKHLKNLKKQEIMEKLAKLRRTAGVEKLPIDLKQLDDDFDPEEHDRAMQAAFNDDYYATNDVSEEKPEFSEVEDESESEAEDLPNWDAWKGDAAVTVEENVDEREGSAVPGHSGEVTVPLSSAESSKAAMSKKRKRSAFAEALSRKKPVFDPVEKKFEQYFDEYYKLDVEDIIADDVRCRFKYRTVQPNDFGLSVEEILTAKDKELNAWVSVKKMSQYRSKDEETYDQKAYKAKASNETKKQRLLHSVYNEKDDEKESSSMAATGTSLEKKSNDVASPEETATIATKKKKKNKKKKKKKKNVKATLETDESNKSSQEKQAVSRTQTSNEQPPSRTQTKNEEATSRTQISNGQPASLRSKRKRMKKTPTARPNTWKRQSTLVERLSDERLASYGVNPKRLKNRVKYSRHKYDQD